IGAAIGFAGSGVDDRRVQWIDRDGADGQTRLRIRQSSPVRAAIGGLPDAATGGPGVGDVAVAGIDRNRGHPARDIAEGREIMDRLGTERAPVRSAATAASAARLSFLVSLPRPWRCRRGQPKYTRGPRRSRGRLCPEEGPPDWPTFRKSAWRDRARYRSPARRFRANG